MYWPVNIARRVTPPLLPQTADHDDADPQEHSEAAIDLAPAPPSSHPSHFILLTPSSIHLYNTRPTQAVASLQRTKRSIREYGQNRKAYWRPGLSVARGAEIVVETSSSYLIVYTIQPSDPAQAYSYTPLLSQSSLRPKTALAPTSKQLKAAFAAGPGERYGSWAASHDELRMGEASSSSGSQVNARIRGAASAALEIRLRLALRIDAGLACCLPTNSHLLISTLNPPAIQAIPWPDQRHTGKQEEQKKTRTVLLEELSWFHSRGGSSNGGVDGGKAAKHANVDNEGPSSSSSASSPPSASPQGTYVREMIRSAAIDIYVWIASDGRAYLVTMQEEPGSALWGGRCFHGLPSRRCRSSVRSRGPAADESTGAADESGVTDKTVDVSTVQGPKSHWPDVRPGQRATTAGINAKMGLIAVGQSDGSIAVYVLRSQIKAATSHVLSLRKALRSTASYLDCGQVQTLQWTSDGLALAVGWQKGWSVWSAWGKLMGHSFVEDLSGRNRRHKEFADIFMDGVRDLFWSPGGTELFVLAGSQPVEPQDASSDVNGKGIGSSRADLQLFVVPHAKSAVAGQHSPDNTRFAFIQFDDGLLVYRGSDQPDMSMINPESDVWQHIKLPQDYLAANWPIKYACISSDGLLIGVSGKRGLAHYSAMSGRWKTFTKSSEAEGFAVTGGMQWFEHVLIVACQSTIGNETEQGSQLRLYSRDTELTDANLLHREKLAAPVVLTSLFEDSLLVYTADNTFYHYLIIVDQKSISLQLCGSITFEGVVGEPERVRGLSWMIPKAQQRFGDPMDDLTVATIIFLIDGKLVLLRPRRSSANPNGSRDTLPKSESVPSEEVAYDMQILGDRIEYYWTHLSGIGTLENSLWGYDGSGIKLWLDALTIEQAEPRRRPPTADDEGQDEGGDDVEMDLDELPEYKTIEESLSMPLDFYPLCVVLEKGLIVGIEHEVSLRKSLDFAIFRSVTSTHLFLHQLLRYYLEQGRLKDAVVCATSYRGLVFFPHALEVLLHSVLEDEADRLQSDDADTSQLSSTGLTSSQSNGSVVEQSMLSASTSAASALSEGPVSKDGITKRSSSPPARLLPVVIDFLDHFDESLQVIVNCARKTEVVRWAYLFSPEVMGRNVTPYRLFERCLAKNDFKTAGSYLLVLHTMHDDGADESHGQSKEAMTATLLRLAASEGQWLLCRDLLRYTRSMDESGQALRKVIELAGLLDDEVPTKAQDKSNHWLSPAQGSTPAPSTTTRRTSAPPPLVAPQEEEEDAATTVANGSPAANRHRSTSSTYLGAAATPPPLPKMSVNGRVLPAASPLTSPGRPTSASTSPSVEHLHFLRRTPSSSGGEAGTGSKPANSGPSSSAS